MSTPSYKFVNADLSRGLISAGEGSTEFYHPLLPLEMFASAGFLILLNGWNLNRCQSDTTGYDGTVATAIHLLQMRAPREPAAPLISWPGQGRVFRPGAKWRYRWYDSRTGEFSGLSPIPDTEINMGVITPFNSTTYLGQTAYFYIPTASKPASADTIQLFANTTQQDDVWYLADEGSIGSSSYVLLTDDNTDDELYLKLSVVTGAPSTLTAGMTWPEGIMPPVVKAWLHPSGRVFYYGLRRFGRSFAGATGFYATVTEGSDLCTISNPSGIPRIIEPGRVGQRVRFYDTAALSDPIEDPTVYRIVKVESAYEFRVWPELKVSSSLTAGASANFFFSIEDDRDARWTWMSEPNKPWLIDPLKTIAAGDDYDDGVMAWFSIGKRVFMQTNRRIYEAVGSASEDPSRSTLFIPVSEEGSIGYWAGCETPFGWVYVHETRGVRYFDGVQSYPLGRGGDPFSDFLPVDQFADFEPSMAEEVRCLYDAGSRTVIISYVPTGQSCLKETLTFHTGERVWRGPHRESVFSTGLLRSTTASNVFVTGDMFGSLSTRESSTKDSPTVTNFLGTGTITSVTSKRIFVDTGSTFLADSDERLRGCPVWFNDGTYNYFARVSDVLTTTTLELDGPPIREDGTLGTLTVGWTFSIGAIRWSLTTGYVDGGGDPARPLEALSLNVRFERGSSAETFECGAAEDGNGTFAGVRVSSSSSAAATRDTNGKVHGEMRLKREGALVQLRLRGTSVYGTPAIARAVLVAEEREGALQ